MRALRKLRWLFQRKRVEKELDEELQYHLEQRTEMERARGLSPLEARAAALRAMEGLEQRREECRDVRRFRLLEDLWQDLHYAARALNKNRGFAAVAVLSLALGIGANTAIFSLVDALLLRPLPVPEAGRLVRIGAGTPGAEARSYLTYPLFEQVRDRSGVFAGIFTWSDHEFQMKSGAEMVHVQGALASGAYFRTLGVNAELGRTFTEENDLPEGGKDGPVAVISDSFWASRFARSPAAIGAALTLDGVRFSIIGVMPPRFFGADVGSRPQIWVPLALTPRVDSPGCMTSRSCWWLIVMARLKDGVPLQQAQARLKVISPQVMRDTVPNWDSKGKKGFLAWQLAANPGANGWTSLRRQFTNPLAVLMTLVGLVLLIACSNLANLLLARASSRQREIAVRIAMGAGRGRMIRQLLTETVLLSFLGAVAGLAFAIWSARLLVALLASSQRVYMGGQEIQFDLRPDWRVLLFTLTAALACGLLFGLAPALRATRMGVSAALKERAQSVRGTGARMGIGRVLLSLQAALSVLLVAGAGLFAGSLWRLATLNPGFNPKGVLVFSLDTTKRPEKGPALAELYDRLLERVRAIPGIRAASANWFTPLSDSGWNEAIPIPGRTDLSEDARLTDLNLVGPDFFRVMEIPLLAGREFQAADGSAAEKVGVLNEVAARRFFPNRSALGVQLTVEGKVIRIVGIAGNAKYMNLQEADPPTLYFPYAQAGEQIPSLRILLKTQAGMRAIYPAFHAALHEIAPDVPIGAVKTMEEQVGDSLGSQRLMASLSVFFSVLALLLTSIGLYGVLAYSVERRTGEIGIRMALGAPRRSVILLVMHETTGHVLAGILAGIVLVLMLSRLIAGLLYGIEPNDAGNLALAVFAFLVVAAVAAYVPAHRAGSLDPLAALREE